MPSATSSHKFKAFRRFNDPEVQHLARLRRRVSAPVRALFDGEGLPNLIAHALIRHRAIDLKEVLESFEFFERVRRRLRRPHMSDLCCGHGLTGMLFAVFEPTVEQVTLVDRKRPDSHAVIRDVVAEFAPWIKPKLRYIEARLEQVTPTLKTGTAVLAVHACGARTDRAIDAALALDGPIAAMPCCYSQTAPLAPRAIRKHLGRPASSDIHRTYRLEAAGYQVDWSSIPECITPMNRIIVAWQPS